MIRITFAALAALALIASGSTLAEAKSIKSQLTPDQVFAYCAQAGANTNSNTTFDLGAGKSVSGSIRCDAADLKASGLAQASAADDNGTETGSDAAEHGAED